MFQLNRHWAIIRANARWSRSQYKIPFRRKAWSLRHTEK